MDDELIAAVEALESAVRASDRMDSRLAEARARLLEVVRKQHRGGLVVDDVSGDVWRLTGDDPE